MISLNVEEKCQNCPNFSPVVDRIETTTVEDMVNGRKRIIQTVYCNNKDFCKNMEDYLRKENK